MRTNTIKNKWKNRSSQQRNRNSKTKPETKWKILNKNISEIKNSLEGINSIIELKKTGKSSKFEDRAIEII